MVITIIIKQLVIEQLVISDGDCGTTTSDNYNDYFFTSVNYRLNVTILAILINHLVVIITSYEHVQTKSA